MYEEKRMVDTYEVKHAIHVGDKESFLRRRYENRLSVHGVQLHLG
jgi:hypothetical protein